jgi:antitoxin component YwqK of YwqJK toxin-antitoxin module
MPSKKVLLIYLLLASVLFASGTISSYDREGLPSKYSGYWETKHPNGKVFEKINYKNGISHGIYLAFYDTGELKESKNYINGGAQGPQKLFNKNGLIQSNSIFKNSSLVVRLVYKYSKSNELISTTVVSKHITENNGIIVVENK